ASGTQGIVSRRRGDGMLEPLRVSLKSRAATREVTPTISMKQWPCENWRDTASHWTGRCEKGQSGRIPLENGVADTSQARRSSMPDSTPHRARRQIRTPRARLARADGSAFADFLPAQRVEAALLT